MLLQVLTRRSELRERWVDSVQPSWRGLLLLRCPRKLFGVRAEGAEDDELVELGLGRSS